MTSLRSSDQFDDFRKERQRARSRQATAPKDGHPPGYENKALKELEEVEKREVLEHRLTREVHDFFQTATAQAAGIVERVARTAQEETGARVEQEMEAFLMDALARMNAFVVAALQQRRAPVAEEEMEPRVGRLVGQVLDDFRWEGTAEGADKHIGQDPFETDVEDVRREFRAQVPENKDATDESVPIEQHLVAAVTDKESETADAPTEAPQEPVAVEEEDVVEEPTPAAKAKAAELERFKSALKTLVKKGTMTKDEARAAWQTRLQTLSKKS